MRGIPVTASYKGGSPGWNIVCVGYCSLRGYVHRHGFSLANIFSPFLKTWSKAASPFPHPHTSPKQARGEEEWSSVPLSSLAFPESEILPCRRKCRTYHEMLQGHSICQPSLWRGLSAILFWTVFSLGWFVTRFEPRGKAGCPHFNKSFFSILDLKAHLGWRVMKEAIMWTRVLHS